MEFLRLMDTYGGDIILRWWHTRMISLGWQEPSPSFITDPRR